MVYKKIIPINNAFLWFNLHTVIVNTKNFYLNHFKHYILGDEFSDHTLLLIFNLSNFVAGSNNIYFWLRFGLANAIND